MKKKFIIILLAIVFLVSIGTFYLNRVILPTKIKSLIIQGLQEKTGKKVTIDSLKFNIIRGLVLENLIISGPDKQFVSIKEATCSFLVLPFFRKQIIIPRLRIKSMQVFLERYADNTFNLASLFSGGKEARGAKKGFNLFIYKVSIVNAKIDFQDDTVKPVFEKSIENANLNLSLSLPASIKFNFNAQIPAQVKLKISAQGEFKILSHELFAKVNIKDLPLQEFAAYYQNLGINFSHGLLDLSSSINFKDNLVNSDLEITAKDILLNKDRLSVKVNTDIKANLVYNLEEKKTTYSGNAAITSADIWGLELIDSIKDIKGALKFNNDGLSSEKLSANCLGIPMDAKIDLKDFAQPFLKVNAVSVLDLSAAKEILKEKFKFALPADLKGNAKFSILLETKIPIQEPPNIEGNLEITDAILKPKELNNPLKNINGKIDFTRNQMKWSGINFDYLDIPYKTTGTLTDFKAPGVQLELTSRQLALHSILALKDKQIRISECAGRFLNSEFSFTGIIDIHEPLKALADINAGINLNLGDLKEPLKNFKEKFEQTKPSGLVRASCNLSGDINDFKNCGLKGTLSSSLFSLYGLKFENLLLDFEQEAGVASIPFLRLTLYEGTLDASAKMNLASQNRPFWVELNLEGMKIEKLKLDTPASNKNISGTIRGQAKINGFFGDLSKLSGAGQVSITDGNLWQLNLFKGLGALLFTTDFTNVSFNEGYCGFFIKDKAVSMDNLKLKSNLADLSGSGKIGFDGSIAASLDVQVSDQAPLTGTFKDVTTAIIGQAGRFGVIKISGSLKEPKYKFKASVADIIKGLSDTFLNK